MGNEKELMIAEQIQISIEESRKQLTDLTLNDVRRIWSPKVTEEEFLLYINIAKAYNLNPFKREIHIVKYSEKSPAAIVVGYETYLKRADRTGKLNGWKTEIIRDVKDWKNDVCRVTIFRKDWVEPFVWEITRVEAVKGSNPIALQMPDFMFKKVTIGQGFRICFPDEMGGMPYIMEEIVQVQHNVKPVTEKPELIEEQEEKPKDETKETPKKEEKPVLKPEGTKMSTEAQIKAITATLMKNPETMSAKTNEIVEKYKVEIFTELTYEQAGEIIKSFTPKRAE